MRGIAVVLVVLYHLFEPDLMFRGGYIGVTIFFTLSGFLITTLLLDEYDRTERIDLVGFWTRRARRLIPALIAVTAATWIYVTISSPEALHEMSLSGVRALTYVSNLTRDPNSFTGLANGLDPLGHVWSLAVEEQAYLVIPVAALVALRRPRAALPIWFGTLGVAGFGLWHWWGSTTSYFVTPFRVAEICVGVALAVARRRAVYEQRTLISSEPVRVVIAVAAPLIVAWATWTWTDWHIQVTYGNVLISAVTAAWIAAVLDQPDWLANRWLRWIGERSYGLYLWHYAIIWATGTPKVVSVLLSLATAEISYRFVEMPIRRGTGYGARLRRPLLSLTAAAAAVAAFMAVMAAI